MIAWAPPPSGKERSKPIASPPKATVKKEAHPRRTWVSVTVLQRVIKVTSQSGGEDDGHLSCASISANTDIIL